MHFELRWYADGAVTIIIEVWDSNASACTLRKGRWTYCFGADLVGISVPLVCNISHKLVSNWNQICMEVIRLQRSGIDTIKYHTWPRIPMGKWQTHRRHHKQKPIGQPFPSRWPQSTYKQTHTKHSKHKTEQKHKRSTKEVPPWNGQ